MAAGENVSKGIGSYATKVTHSCRDFWASPATRRRVAIGKILLVVVGSLIIVAPIGLGWGLIIFAKKVSPVPPIDSIVYLDQGRNWPDYRLGYYSIPQGASIEDIRYKWFIELERPFSRQKFATRDYLEATGFLMDPSHDERLPVGITKRLDPVLNEEVIDITCAACHTGQIAIEVDGEYVGLRVDGGQAMHAFTSIQFGHFGTALLASMVATYSNQFKFDRFARNVLCDSSTEPDCSEEFEMNKAHLRKSFAASLVRLVNKAVVEPGYYPTHEGFGRVDALARIGNRVFGERIDPESNFRKGNAPVNYPQLWDIWKLDRVQFTGSVRQPLARNVGQVLGTGANYRFVGEFGTPLHIEEIAKTSIEFENLYKLEIILRELEPPRWPADKLPGLAEWQIDKQRAAAGRELFDERCRGCHGPRPVDPIQKAIEAPLKGADDAHWAVHVFPYPLIGTDPNSAENFVNNRFDMSRMGLSEEVFRSLLRPLWIEKMVRTIRQENAPDFLGTWNMYQCTPFATQPCPRDQEIVTAISQLPTAEAKDRATEWLEEIYNDLDSIDLESVSLGQGLNLLGLLIRNKYYERHDYFNDPDGIMDYEGFGILDMPDVVGGYKARPLAGVWATAPYLHNGSVPTVYQLLSPDEAGDAAADRRCDVFYVGLRGYDPKHLGLPATENCGKSGSSEEFDTSEAGNANTGHWFRNSYVGRARDGVIGPELSPEQRFQIIEYLKCLRDVPGATMDPACR